MQEGIESQGTTQPGTGDAPLLLPIHEGFWIWRRKGGDIFIITVFSNEHMKNISPAIVIVTCTELFLILFIFFATSAAVNSRSPQI